MLIPLYKKQAYEGGKHTPNPATPLTAATTCHGTVPCLLPLIPLNLAKSPNPLNCPKTSLSKFSAAVRVCNVGVHVKLL